MKFPAWKKEKLPPSKDEGSLTNEETRIPKTEVSGANTKTREMETEQSSQTIIENVTEQKPSKLEDSRDFIIKTITKSGYPLVIRSEQNILVQEEIKNEIVLLLEEDEKLTEQILKSNKHITEDDEYLLRTANFYYFQGNVEKAIERYDLVLKRNPSKMTALNNKGVSLDSIGKHGEAIEYFNNALKRVPENVHLLSNKGIALYKNEKYDEALACFDLALKLESNYVNALIFKGHTLYRLGKNNVALDCYSKVIRLEQNNAEALYNKACLCALKGDEYGAITSLERAIHLDPSWKEAAIDDKDLDRIKSSSRFSELVQSSN